MGVTLTMDVAAVRHNVAAWTRRLADQHIEVVGVTKAVDGQPEVGRAMLEGGAVALADSRLTSLARLAEQGLGPRILIRPPEFDELDTALDVADGVLLSDLSTARALSARPPGTRMPVLMVVDLGDRRDGVLPDDAVALAARLADLPGLSLAGLAVNFACLSGLQPSLALFQQADAILGRIADWCAGEPLLSIGGTYCLPHLLHFRPRHRCLVRLGAGLYFGHYTLPTMTPIPGLLRADPILTATVIESRRKPGPPEGLVGPDAFGHVPARPLPRRVARHVLLAMGRRETEIQCLRPLVPHSYVAGMSSDHTLLVVDDGPAAESAPAGGEAAARPPLRGTGAPHGDHGDESAGATVLRAGDTVDFALDYEGLVRAVGSPFVRKVFTERHYCDACASPNGARGGEAAAAPRPGRPGEAPAGGQGQADLVHPASWPAAPSGDAGGTRRLT